MNRVLYAIGILSAAFFCWYVFSSIGRIYLAGQMGFSKGFYTIDIGCYLFAFFGYSFFMDLMGLIRVKTKAVKILSIIGMAMAVLATALDGYMLNGPSKRTFDDIGHWFLPFGLVWLAISVIGLIHSIRLKK